MAFEQSWYSRSVNQRTGSGPGRKMNQFKDLEKGPQREASVGH